MYRRVVVVLADGLRPDAVTPAIMPSLHTLGQTYTRAEHAVTVRPSVTVAALGSLATGVRPEAHGLIEPGIGFLSRMHRLHPLGDELHRHGHDIAVVLPEMGRFSRSLVGALARAASIGKLVTGGNTARSLARTARQVLSEISHGLVVLYLADCDGAGHAHGWMSQPYLAAAARVDAALAEVAPLTRSDLLIVLSDHGGGGIDPRDHDHPHPTNARIPLVLAGASVRRGTALRGPVSLLDVPPTILWALGAAIPGSYEGRVLREVFAEPAVTTRR
jgi:hypothetical protein